MDEQARGAVGSKLAAMMFLQFFVWGAWYVTLGNFMFTSGMAGSIGDAYTVSPIAALISPFFLGMFADRFFSTQRILGVMHLCGAVALAAAGWVGSRPEASPGLFVGLLLVHMLCYMPTLGLVNTLSFHHMKDPAREFPRIRLFGTVGWIVSNVVVSRVLHADNEALPLYIGAGGAVILGLFSFALPNTPPPSKGKRVRVRDVLGLEALSLLRHPSFVVFLVASMLICIPLAGYYAFAQVFVKQTGFRDPAFTMSFGQVSEVVFMLVMPLCFARLGVKWMLVVGMGAWVLRYALFAGADDAMAAWMVLGGILLHGVCYDFFFVTGQVYVDRKAPARIRGQAQGFLVLATLGIGLGVGAQLFGALVKANTPQDAGVHVATGDALREVGEAIRRGDRPAAQVLAARLDEQEDIVAKLRSALELAKETGSDAIKAEEDLATATAIHAALVDFASAGDPTISGATKASRTAYMKSTAWPRIWLIPAIAAGVVMLGFAALFRDREAESTPVGSGP